MSQASAIKLYEDFHKYEPKKVGQFPKSFKIPTQTLLAGPALYVLYRSSKLDPVTYAKPKNAINYIHKHNKGVNVYVTKKGKEGRNVERKVPQRIHKVTSLTLLGKFLGFGFLGVDGEEVAMEASGNVELYSIPSGKGLLVIENKRKVLAFIWGGKLRVEPRGIVG